MRWNLLPFGRGEVRISAPNTLFGWLFRVSRSMRGSSGHRADRRSPSASLGHGSKYRPPKLSHDNSDNSERPTAFSESAGHATDCVSGKSCKTTSERLSSSIGCLATVLFNVVHAAVRRGCSFRGRGKEYGEMVCVASFRPNQKTIHCERCR